MGANDDIDTIRRSRVGLGVEAPPVLRQTVSHERALSWGAVLAGAAGAAALSLILLILGTGLGLSSVSPWTAAGVSAATFGVSTIVWITFTQLAASGLGGYLAGRLRHRFADAATDEIYFRDTAHGFLAWAVATLATAALLSSAIGSILGAGAHVGAVATGTAATGLAATGAAAAGMGSSNAGSSNAGMTSSSGATEQPGPYFVDALFRSTNAPAADAAPLPTAEVMRIFAHDVRNGALPAADQQYVAQLVAQRTGMSPADAQTRVNTVYTNLQTQLNNAETTARQAADKARKASAYAALWLFVSLLAGAFVASLAATFGGRQREL